jgi:hypothetical protein
MAKESFNHWRLKEDPDIGLGYGERECSKETEAKDSSRKELRSSPTPSWDNKSMLQSVGRENLFTMKVRQK